MTTPEPQPRRDVGKRDPMGAWHRGAEAGRRQALDAAEEIIFRHGRGATHGKGLLKVVNASLKMERDLAAWRESPFPECPFDDATQSELTALRADNATLAQTVMAQVAEIEGSRKELQRQAAIPTNHEKTTRACLAEIARMGEALEEIAQMHIGDCPAALGHLTELEWAQRMNGNLRRVARAALADPAAAPKEPGGADV